MWCVQYDDDRTKHETISQTEPKINSSWNEDNITRLSLLALHNSSSSMEKVKIVTPTVLEFVETLNKVCKK